MTEDFGTPTPDEMESLFVNNEKLDRISSYLNRFNPIRIMRMQEMEIRHSAILAWLFDPQETHGFGDRFLKAFLSEALRGQSELGTPTAIEVTQSDLRDAEVRTEWQRIDVFILSPSNRWAFVIENKFHSKQRDGQLAEYIEKVKSAFESRGKTLAVRGIFLTLHDEEPQHPGYVPARYAAICDFLPRLIAQEGQSIGQEVTVFLHHYLEVIRDAADMSGERREMEKLARQLYLSHRKVLDFVIEYGAKTEFTAAVETLFGEQTEYGGIVQIDRNSYMYSDHGPRSVSFLPDSWYEALGKNNYDWPGCANWWAEYPLICWLQLFDRDDGARGSLRLYAEVGPISNHEFRKGLIEAIQSAAIDKNLECVRFQQGAADEGKRYSKFLKQNSIEVNDIHDAEEIEMAMRKLLQNFQPCFGAVSDVLRDFVRYGMT